VADQAPWPFGGPNPERGLGSALAVVVGVVCVIALALRSAFADGQPAANVPGRVEAVIAAIMAYVFYVSGALLADDEFPEFLREHLFDGLPLRLWLGSLSIPCLAITCA